MSFVLSFVIVWRVFSFLFYSFFDREKECKIEWVERWGGSGRIYDKRKYDQNIFHKNLKNKIKGK